MSRITINVDEEYTNISGWYNIVTGNRRLLLEHDNDNSFLQGKFRHLWYCHGLFKNKQAAMIWKAEEELVPDIFNIQGCEDAWSRNRHIVASREDLQLVHNDNWNNWKYVRSFCSMKEAKYWETSSRPRSPTDIHPSESKQADIDLYHENMVHSYHRDRYGYDYYASLGYQSYYTNYNINWNDHTTGNWKKEESMREGFRRYGHISTSEWIQTHLGHK